jgi:hypothetical protein
VTLRQFHFLKVAAAAAIVAILYLLPWPIPVVGDLLKLTCLAIIFVLLTFYLRVASWPLTLGIAVVLCLTALTEFDLNSTWPETLDAATRHTFRGLVLGIFAVLWSPIILIGPVVGGSATHAILRRLRPNYRMERP